LIIDSPKDLVFISTMNLDGETNLKERMIPFDSIKEKHLNRFKGDLLCDFPNESLESWDGNLTSTLLDKVYNCSIKNTVLRGCTLRNTEYCTGVVVYVGNNSKIMMNSKKPPRKISNLMKIMNFMLYTVFAF
jgi:magnesium-transporting ATPase (P-type)